MIPIHRPHILHFSHRSTAWIIFVNMGATHCPLPADGLIRGTMTGALLCSLEVVRDEFVEEEEEGDEDGTLEDSLSPLFMARTDWLTLASKLLGFGEEFSERHKWCHKCSCIQQLKAAVLLTWYRNSFCAQTDALHWFWCRCVEKWDLMQCYRRVCPMHLYSDSMSPASVDLTLAPYLLALTHADAVLCSFWHRWPPSLWGLLCRSRTIPAAHSWCSLQTSAWGKKRRLIKVLCKGIL